MLSLLFHSTFCCAEPAVAARKNAIGPANRASERGSFISTTFLGNAFDPTFAPGRVSMPKPPLKPPLFRLQLHLFAIAKSQTANPSHLGSYCHSSPFGISSAICASIGGYGIRSAISQELLQSHAPGQQKRTKQ